ncbi:hypothetical protein HELRODRAFT_191725 [Helobdella robusta]|uniref:Uncharacterized protein n=1 Tax=Helobdella robusta TaxID=6412 RepID=T1FT84_HELRO|nr:hypothetical protein HELRODRAFT_191725 [Helobdella robusta]ESO04780.1 hypothetical protein HELRODRAFT_191725 [Helobdella robusta]
MPHSYKKFNNINGNNNNNNTNNSANRHLQKVNTTNNDVSSDNYYYGPCRSNDSPTTPLPPMGHASRMMLLSKGIKPEPNYLLLGEVEKELRAVKEKSKFEKTKQNGFHEPSNQQQQHNQQSKQQHDIQQLDVSNLLNEMKMSKKWQNLNVSGGNNLNGNDNFSNVPTPEDGRQLNLPKKRQAPPIPVDKNNSNISNNYSNRNASESKLQASSLNVSSPNSPYQNPSTNLFLFPNNNGKSVTVTASTASDDIRPHMLTTSTTDLSSAQSTSANSLFDDFRKGSSFNLLQSLDEYLNAAEVGKLHASEGATVVTPNEINSFNYPNNYNSSNNHNNSYNIPWNKNFKNGDELNSHPFTPSTTSNYLHHTVQPHEGNKTSTPITYLIKDKTNIIFENNSKQQHLDENTDVDLLNFKTDNGIPKEDGVDGIMGNFVLRSKSKFSLDGEVVGSSTMNGTVKVKPSDIKKHRIWLNLNPGLKVNQQLPPHSDRTDDTNINSSNLSCYDVLNDSGFHNNYNDHHNGNMDSNDSDTNFPRWSGYPASGKVTKITNKYRSSSATELGVRRKSWDSKLANKHTDKFMRETKHYCGRNVDIEVWWLIVIIMVCFCIGFICGFLPGWFTRKC